MTDDTNHVLAIQKTLADYCVCIDTGDFDAVRTLFAPDAELHAFGEVWRGPDDIVARLESGARGLHLTGMPSVGVDGDWATSRQEFAFLSPEREILRMGLYHDELVQRDGAWQFRRRRIDFVS
jgi:hypothetical protein